MTPRWVGTLEYGAALRMQEHARFKALNGGESLLLGLEHLPVITLGKRGGEVAGTAASAGYAVWNTRRGGLATCHEPGQLVGYLIVDARVQGVRRLVETVEGCLIEWLTAHHLPAVRRVGYPGVWAEGESGWSKVAAVGMQVRNGWTNHGFALNLQNSLTGFNLISPCGIADATVTSLQQVAGASPTPCQAFEQLAPALCSALC
jgi:lipoyl(octanoyl) transferase